MFGPIPRSYAQYVPRQVRALARKSAFNARARENAIVVIETFDFDAPKTKQLQALVERLGGANKNVLVLTNGTKPNVFLSGRNLPNVHVLPYSDVSTYHLLWSDVVLIEATAIGQTLSPVAEKESTPVKRAKAAKPEAEEKTAARKSRAKTKAKAAPKKAAAKKTSAAKKKSAPKKKGK